MITTSFSDLNFHENELNKGTWHTEGRLCRHFFVIVDHMGTRRVCFVPGHVGDRPWNISIYVYREYIRNIYIYIHTEREREKCT